HGKELPHETCSGLVSRRLEGLHPLRLDRVSDIERLHLRVRFSEASQVLSETPRPDIQLGMFRSQRGSRVRTVHFSLPENGSQSAELAPFIARPVSLSGEPPGFGVLLSRSLSAPLLAQ